MKLTTHDRLIKGLKARGCIEAGKHIVNPAEYTVMKEAKTDWKYYVSKSGQLRRGLDINTSVSIPTATKRVLIKEGESAGAGST